jgi:ketosteroid isomerase-like protein
MAITDPTKAHVEFATAFNAGDLEALCDMYEPTALMPSEAGTKHARGIEAIRETLQGYLGMNPIMQIESKFVHQNADLALLRAHWSVKGAAPDGSNVEMSADSVELIRRQPDGTWRYVIDHPFGAS